MMFINKGGIEMDILTEMTALNNGLIPVQVCTEGTDAFSITVLGTKYGIFSKEDLELKLESLQAEYEGVNDYAHMVDIASHNGTICISANENCITSSSMTGRGVLAGTKLSSGDFTKVEGIEESFTGNVEVLSAETNGCVVTIGESLDTFESFVSMTIGECVMECICDNLDEATAVAMKLYKGDIDNLGEVQFLYSEDSELETMPQPQVRAMFAKGYLRRTKKGLKYSSKPVKRGRPKGSKDKQPRKRKVKVKETTVSVRGIKPVGNIGEGKSIRNEFVMIKQLNGDEPSANDPSIEDETIINKESDVNVGMGKDTCTKPGTSKVVVRKHKPTAPKRECTDSGNIPAKTTATKTVVKKRNVK